MKYNRISCLILGVIFLFAACGCSSNVNAEYDNLYSREAVEYFSSRIGFGGGRTDVETVILKYIYDNSELTEKYGENFCVSNMGGSDEGKTFLFMWLYRGTGVYFVEICDDTWTVKVSKSYFGKWEVTECCQDDTWGTTEET